MTDILTFLGTGDAMGVPRVYCDCYVCQEARSTGKNMRLRSSVHLQTAEDELFIDCGPDWTKQMQHMGLRAMKHAIITHAHFDHIGGLPEWADACRWLGYTGNVYAAGDVLETLRLQFPWLEGHLTYHDVSSGFSFGDWDIMPRQVCHGKNGTSYAYRFRHRTSPYAWAYCSDSINLSREEKAFLYDLDLLILGTSFYQEEAEFHTRSVYDMMEAQALIEELRPTRTVFTHMSHAVDVTANYPLPASVSLAYTGMPLSIPGL